MNNTEAFEKLNQKINSLIQKYSDQKGIIDLKDLLSQKLNS